MLNPIPTSKTRRSYQVLGFIKSHIELNHEPPTLDEIKQFLGFSSVSGVHEILVAMEGMGLIKRDRKWRGITIVTQNRIQA